MARLNIIKEDGFIQYENLLKLEAGAEASKSGHRKSRA